MPTEQAGCSGDQAEDQRRSLWSPARALDRSPKAEKLQRGAGEAGGSGRNPAVSTGGEARPALRQINELITSADVEEFLDLLRNGDPGDPLDALEAHLERGVSVERLYLDILGPVARRLGELWEEDRCDYFEVTLRVGRIQQLIRLMSARVQANSDVSGRPLEVFLAGPHGDHHSLGLLLVGDFFFRAGWYVSMGSSIDIERTAQEVASGRFDLIGFSITREEVIDEVRDTISAIRKVTQEQEIPILVGGPFCLAQPKIADYVGATGWASDGVEALSMAQKLCGNATLEMGT